MNEISTKLILKYLFRVLFVAALFWAGFNAEHLYQSRLASVPNEISQTTKTPIVILGGSMATGLGTMIEHHLAPELGAEVIEVTTAMLSSDQVAARTPEIVAKYKPKLLLVQVGLNEENPDETGWETKALEHLRSRDSKSFVAVLGPVVSSGKPEEMKRLSGFILRSQDEIRDSGLTKSFIELVDKRMMGLLPKIGKKKDARESLVSLVVVARLLENLTGSADLQKAMRLTPAERAEKARSTFRRIVGLARAWPAELSRLGVLRFVREADPRQKSIRIWFSAVWEERDRKSERSGIDFFAAHPEKVMNVFSWPFHLARDPRAAALLQPEEPRRLWNALFNYRSKNDFEHFNEDAAVETERGQFDRNIKAAVAAARANDVRVILVQFPNRDLRAVTEIGLELGVPVIESRKLFKNKIADFGREMLFIDRIGTSGHLTDEGLDLYGKHIAERIDQELGAGTR